MDKNDNFNEIILIEKIVKENNELKDILKKKENLELDIEKLEKEKNELIKIIEKINKEIQDKIEKKDIFFAKEEKKCTKYEITSKNLKVITAIIFAIIILKIIINSLKKIWKYYLK